MKKYDNFGCSLNFYSEYEPKHGTEKTTIIYLLEGTVWITLADSKFKMQKDDLILVNYGQDFMWHQEGDNA